VLIGQYFCALLQVFKRVLKKNEYDLEGYFENLAKQGFQNNLFLGWGTKK